MRLRYTPQSRQDLWELKEYISVELSNPSAAENIVSGILKSCAKLKDQPGMGIRLAQKTGRDTELLYIVTGKHLVFYRIEKNDILIIRILDSRTNYLKVLFRKEEQ
ncbi:MAG: type II toxin-antitoxin system RelE/ParE family toxin [Eubacteriales bacterium]|nr:type II toxin-antitoxin system RelE/ParE family toxin [Eubacteriales bacterium]